MKVAGDTARHTSECVTKYESSFTRAISCIHFFLFTIKENKTNANHRDNLTVLELFYFNSKYFSLLFVFSVDSLV